jgi:hypothetical protein
VIAGGPQLQDVHEVDAERGGDEPRGQGEQRVGVLPCQGKLADLGDRRLLLRPLVELGLLVAEVADVAEEERAADELAARAAAGRAVPLQVYCRGAGCPRRSPRPELALLARAAVGRPVEDPRR